MLRSRAALGFLLIASGAAVAQQYVVSTVAGGAPPPTPIAGTNVSIGGPQAVVADTSGNLYFTSIDSIFRIDQNGILTLIAGNARGGYSGDGGPALTAQLNFTGNFSGLRLFPLPNGLSIDSAGSLYVADTNNGRVRKISPAGAITTVAGGGTVLGDGGSATSAQLTPQAVTVDGSGNLYIAEFNGNRVRKVSPNGTITTFAGTGTRGYSGDGGPAVAATLNDPIGVTVDSSH